MGLLLRMQTYANPMKIHEIFHEISVSLVSLVSVVSLRLLDVNEQVKLRESLRPKVCKSASTNFLDKLRPYLRARTRFPRRPWLDVISKIDIEEKETKASLFFARKLLTFDLDFCNLCRKISLSCPGLRSKFCALNA